MVIRNRFVRSATVDNSAESGYVSEKQIKLFTDLAQGGVGLIVTGMTCVHPSDHIRPSQNSLASDQYVPGYKKLTASVHDCGAKIAVQLAHAGRERGKFIKDKKDQAIAPSFIEDDPYCETKNYRTMTRKRSVRSSRPSVMPLKGPEKQTSMPSSFTGLMPFCSLSSFLRTQIAETMNGEVLLKTGFASTTKFTRPSERKWGKIILCS